MSDVFKNVGELIDHLEKLGRDKSLMVDLDGSTFHLQRSRVTFWNENDPESPVAFFAPMEWE